MAAGVGGIDKVLSKLKGVEARVRKKAVKQAVTQGVRTVLWDAKGRVRKVTGQLRKSLGQKVKTYRNGGVTVGLVGPRRGFKIPVRVIGRKPNAGKVVYANPTQYSHLIEKGTSRSRAFPFLSAALESSKDAVQRSMANVIGNAIEDAAK